MMTETKVITVSDLHKSYSDEIKAVNGLNLSIREGEIYGLLGPNGAGKSSTIKMLIGMIRPSDGSITILNRNMPKDVDQLVDKIGYVPQELIFYEHLTVRENLKFFGTMYEIINLKDRMEELLELLEIKSIEKRRAGQLSGGQKRRLNLAIGLLNNPQILILDEPAAGMDPQSRNVLWEAVKRFAKEQNVTIILTTHLMETVDRLADRIGIIDNGIVIEEGTSDELKAKYGKGDVLEFNVKPEVNIDISVCLNSIRNRYPEAGVVSAEGQIKVNMPHIITIFSDLVTLVEQHLGKENISSVSMHENTLEDVFIHLTGRELRE